MVTVDDLVNGSCGSAGAMRRSHAAFDHKEERIYFGPPFARSVEMKRGRSVPATAAAVVARTAAAIVHGATGLRCATHRRMRQPGKTAARCTELRTRCHRHTATAHRSRLAGRT